MLRASDSVTVRGVLAGVDGKFSFEKLDAGSYRLRVTSLNFKTYLGDVFSIDKGSYLDVPDIKLTSLSRGLNEVTVRSQKPMVEQRIDRTIVNVNAMISVAGGNALDVLDKSPGVIVENDGKISLKGKGVTIFIDDKPTYLSGTDLENYLRTLSSSVIDQIELMPNPPAKYDAAGNGGVINIRTIKNKAAGFNGSTTLSYSQGRYGKTNNSLNFNYKHNKINAFGNFTYNTSNGFNDLDINRHFENSIGAVTTNFLQNSFIRKTGHGFSAKFGIDFYASENTTFGLGSTGQTSPGNRRSLVASNFSDAQHKTDSVVTANSDEQTAFKNEGINLNFRHLFNKNGKELTADLDYLNYRTNTDQNFVNVSRLPNGNITQSDLLLGFLPAHIDIFSAKTDYSHPFKSGLKLDAGLKASYTKTDNTAGYFYGATGGALSPDYSKTNRFLYKENIAAAYLNFSRNFKRLSVQFGLRTENASSDGHQLGNSQKPDSTFKRNYTGLFPTVYFQYKLDSAGNNTFSLNYGRRIDRPYYQDLNPFLSPLDKFTYYAGNPFLKPSSTNTLELSHTFMNKWTTTFTYSKTSDDVNETIEIVNGIYYSRPGNIGSSVSKGVSVDGGLDITKWLNFHFFGLVNNIHSVSDFYTGRLNTKGTYFFFRPVLSFSFKKDWNFQIDYGRQSKLTTAQFVSGVKEKATFAVSKKLSPSATVKFVLNDVFYSFVNSGDINNLKQTRADYRNLSDTRTGVLSFTYRFGKTISNLRKYNANGAEAEQNRVKN